MSLEQAIIDHTAALRELSASLNAMNAGRGAALALSAVAGGVKTDAELKEAVTKVEQKAAAEAKKPETKKPEPKAEVPNAKLPEDGAGSSDAAPLVYTTDVKPTLLKLNKEKGRDALAGLLKKYDAPNGDKIKQDDLALILADAEALLAA